MPEADHEQVFLYRERYQGRAVQTLKIDIDQIMMGDDLSTNYQILPGDKLVVHRRRDLAAKSDGEERTKNATRRQPPDRPRSQAKLIPISIATKRIPLRRPTRARKRRAARKPCHGAWTSE